MPKIKNKTFVCSVCRERKDITELSGASHGRNNHGNGRGRENIYWCFDCDDEWADIKRIADGN